MKESAPHAAAPACMRLARELRELKARTGLSLAVLAERTAYSKSSWERYLNGRQLAPRQAVEALCATASEPPGRLTALWELADAEWSGRARGGARPGSAEEAAQPGHDEPGDRAPTPDQAEQGPRKANTVRRRWAVVVAVCAVGVAAAVWAAVQPDAGAGNPVGQGARTPPPDPGCRAHGCVGRDPGLMGCGMPGEVRALGRPHRTSTGAWMEIRYNSGCEAAWARIWHSHVGDALDVSLPGGKPQRAEVADKYDAEDYLYTPMIDGSDLTGLRMCFEPAGGGSRECFRR
ncbi:helix-turn-helix domain-containing protein [Streptomyces sp. NPDC001222]|uniref:helix-turn-helix domain-containing protein n=1 Tax=Streptomyces sp. NPDC001222 TaxID=3364548 RepID=UPI0036739922